ncbi:MAG TPA: ABC transporter permease [Candidatus Acidoferrales bacterium]|nr:ABC transporter permease [Candidatus Acidoferrales bacterium]
MRPLRRLLARFTNFIARRDDRRLQEEIAAHVALQTAENLRAGLSPSEARRQALLKFGPVESIKEDYRAERGLLFLETLWQDLHFAFRMLRKSPGFTAVAVLTLALGIGANTAMFSVTNAVLLRPLPYPEPGRLVRVWGVNRRTGNLRAWTSYPNLEDLRRQNAVFSALGASREDEWAWTGGAQPERLAVARVTEDFFSVLDIQPSLGRSFSREEFQTGGEKVVILSYAFWQSRFGSNPGVIGQTLTLEERAFTIVGILPKSSFPFPSATIAFWVPLPVGSEDSSRGSRNLDAIARLRPGVSLAQAQAEITTIASRLERLYPDSNVDIGYRLEPLQEALVSESRHLLLVLAGVICVVLLIACLNVVNLLLSRVQRREREIAMRIALGANRGRIIRQLLTESVLLSSLGGVLGLALAGVGTKTLLLFFGANLPRQQEISIDTWVLLFSIIAMLFSGALIGLIPAIETTRPHLADKLKEASDDSGSAQRRVNFRDTLVVVEVAMALVLLTGAGLLLKSFWRLANVRSGFEPEGVLTLRVSLADSRYPTHQRALAFYDQALARLGALPTAQSAAAISMLPLSGDRSCNDMTVENRPIENADCVEGLSISPDYFRVMKIPLLAGRWFAEADLSSAPRVAVINDSLARLLGSRELAMDERLSFRGEKWQIVGVVGDEHQRSLGHVVEPEIFLPLQQQPLAFATFVLRMNSHPEASASAARQQLWALDPDLMIYDVLSMNEVVSASILQPRMRLFLLGGFAGLALLLAILGLAGVVAYSVSQRTREFGIRMALGAPPSEVLRMVLTQGLSLALTGAALGVVASLWLTRFLANLLFQVKPLDAVSFAGGILILLTAALAACWIPARRAMRVDPMVALRYE